MNMKIDIVSNKCSVKSVDIINIVINKDIKHISRIKKSDKLYVIWLLKKCFIHFNDLAAELKCMIYNELIKCYFTHLDMLLYIDKNMNIRRLINNDLIILVAVDCYGFGKIIAHDEMWNQRYIEQLLINKYVYINGEHKILAHHDLYRKKYIEMYSIIEPHIIKKGSLYKFKKSRFKQNEWRYFIKSNWDFWSNNKNWKKA